MNWESIVSTIVAVGFGIATLVLAVTRVKRKKPVWGYDVREIIGLGSKAPPEVKLSFNDEEIKDVYRTVVIFFNKGNEPIDKKDVAKRIVVDFGVGKILKEPMLLSISKEENNFSANKVGDNSVELGFHYLGHNDGACIEVMHTRGSPPSMSGTIIDTPIKQIGGFAEDIESPGIIKTVICGIALVGFGVYFGLEGYSALSDVGEPIVTSRLFFMACAATIVMILTVILRDDIPQIIRATKFPAWGRDISKIIVEAKLTGMGEPIFAYCPKCRHKVEIIEVKPVRMRSGRRALRGRCADCKTMVVRIGTQHEGK